VQKIREEVQKALDGDIHKCLVKLPESFQVEIGYKEQDKAYRMSFFPGARLKDAHTLQFEADNYFDVLRLFAFVL
jgi:D-amino peptidase